MKCSTWSPSRSPRPEPSRSTARSPSDISWPGAPTIGSVLPSCILVTLIARLYLKYRSLNALRSALGTLRPAVVAMIAYAGVSILMTAFWGEGAAVTLAETNWVLFGIFAVCFLLLRKTKLNPIAVMVLAGVLNLAAALISGGA